MQFLTSIFNGDQIFFWASQKDLYDPDKLLDAYIDSAGELLAVWVRVGDLGEVEEVKVARVDEDEGVEAV